MKRSVSTAAPQKETGTAVISVDELIQSEIVILRSLQQSHYAPEVKALQNRFGNKSRFEDRKDARERNHQVKQTSMDPFIDLVGLLGVGGRIRRASLPHAVKHPVIIPKSGHITELIIHHFHFMRISTMVSVLKGVNTCRDISFFPTPKSEM
jgi:hypothetical protein